MLNSTDAEELTIDEVVESAYIEESLSRDNKPSEVAAPAPTPPIVERTKNEGTYTQWAIGPNGRFSPVGAAIPHLSPGVYEPFASSSSWGVEQLELNNDQIYELPDMVTNEILAESEVFWNSEPLYKKHNLLFKRGIIMHGPPGGGKTVTVKMLIRELIKRKGIVLVVKDVLLSMAALKAIKRIEPNRNLICIFEDIDEIIGAQGEANVLSMLDGEHNVTKVMNLATTNYPDRLGARLINRPSRFDRAVFVGMPQPAARAHYLKLATDGELDIESIQTWTMDTENFSIAHLRELVAAVFCLQQPYEDVINRLKKMAERIKSEEGFKGKNVGFGGIAKVPQTRYNFDE